MRLDQRCQHAPRHHRRHLGEKHIRFVRFFFSAKSSDAKLSWSIAHSLESMREDAMTRGLFRDSLG
jgi:hypothetical protein